MGNLFSVRQACLRAGLEPSITSKKAELLEADGVILPGVGAFGRAMETLREQGLVSVLKDLAAAGRPFMGICLGLQLLFDESIEFGRHEGMAIFAGQVVRLEPGIGPAGRPLKIPEIGWKPLRPPSGRGWDGSLLEGLPEGAHMYFVHSFHALAAKSESVLAITPFGDMNYCAAVQQGRLFACQFHPERSGPVGLKVYENFRKMILSGR